MSRPIPTTVPSGSRNPPSLRFDGRSTLLLVWVVLVALAYAATVVRCKAPAVAARLAQAAAPK